MIVLYLILIFIAFAMYRRMRRLDGVKCLLIYKDSILIVQRNRRYCENNIRNKEFDTPGGKYERWKDLLGSSDTAARCLYEDTGLSIGALSMIRTPHTEFRTTTGGILDVYAIRLDYYQYTQLNRLGIDKIMRFDPLCDSIKSFRWVDIDDLGDPIIDWNDVVLDEEERLKSIKQFNRSLLRCILKE
jgi:hypothetical protein